MLVTSCRKIFTIALSALAFGHPLNGFHMAGVAAVFGGVLLNAHSERRCARLLALPALVAMGVLLATECLQPLPAATADAPPAWPAWLPEATWPYLAALAPLRLALSARIINGDE